MANQVTVEFKEAVHGLPYAPGDIATVDENIAKKVIKMGAAKEYKASTDAKKK